MREKEEITLQNGRGKWFKVFKILILSLLESSTARLLDVSADLTLRNPEISGTPRLCRTPERPLEVTKIPVMLLNQVISHAICKPTIPPCSEDAIEQRQLFQ